MRSIHNQFPANMIPNCEIIQRIESMGFSDSSWGNDEYPSYEREETNEKIYIIGNYDDADDADDDDKTAVSWTIVIVRCNEDGHDCFVCSYIVS